MLTRCMHCGEKTARRCKTGDCRHCDACGKDFIPCSPSCPGFFLNTDKEDGCPIEICDECVSESKVPAEDRLSDLDARSWPEAYTTAAKLLKHREREAKKPWSPPVAEYPKRRVVQEDPGDWPNDNDQSERDAWLGDEGDR